MVVLIIKQIKRINKLRKNNYLIREDILMAIRHFFSTGSKPTKWNPTFIAPISKIEYPSKLYHSRHVLCKIRKLVPKPIMTNRLMRILPKFLFPKQIVFVKGRCIANNRILTQVLLHSMSIKGINSRLMAIKLDMQWANDRLKWDCSCFRKCFFRQFWINKVDWSICEGTTWWWFGGWAWGWGLGICS